MSARKKSSKMCTKCQSTKDVLPIVFGLPTDDDFKQAGQEKIMLGGCVVTGDEPRWYCRTCGREW